MTTIELKVRARIIQHLGEELIRNEKIAVIELVKNSYDADARNVIVEFIDLENKENAKIIITDDGSGMSEEIIRNVWFEIGTPYRKNQYERRELTPKFKRLPIGEKGIGRFGAHKLGQEITLISKEISNEKEVYFKIDWSEFSDDKYLSEIKIPVISRKPEIFKDAEEHGTKIIIGKLKSEWTRGMIRDLYRSLNSLINPFEDIKNFSIELLIENDEWIEDLLSWQDIRKFKLFSFKVVIENDSIIDFQYRFEPWKTMGKLPERSLSIEDLKAKKMIKIKREGRRSSTETINLGGFQIGKISFEGMIFDRDNTILSLAEIRDRKGLIEYLNVNSGIKVFRDNLRVYNYGELGDDWLGLDSKRVNLPGERLSNNLIIANINLERENSTDLKEKTNREGFIENNAYRAFVDAIEYAIRLITMQRNYDKNKIRKYYGTDYKKEPILTGLDELKNQIETKIEDEEIRDEFYRYIKRIETNYIEIQKSFVKFAGTGFSLSIAIHEIEKSIKSINAQTKIETISDNLLLEIKRLSDIVEKFTIFIQKFDMKKHKLKELVEEALFYIKPRIEKHDIEIITNYKEKEIINDIIECDKSLILTAILNILDNSIWWLNYKKLSYKFQKKIFIDIINKEDKLYVIFADNGLGFAIPTENMIKPFISAKDDGMGLGLFITEKIMELHNSEIIFPNAEILNLSKEFKEGAIVELMFRRI